MAVTDTTYAVADIPALKALTGLPASGSGLYYARYVNKIGWYQFDPDAISGGIAPDSGSGRWYALHREVLTASRIYYVRTDGNDNNTGLANTSGGAFLTIQKAIDTVATLDLSIFDVTIQVGNGTYNQQLILKSVAGSGNIFITGDTTTPSNVTITSPTFPTILSETQSPYDIKGFTINCTDGTFKISISSENGNIKFGNIIFPDFGSGGYHINANGNKAKIECSANYEITGGALIHAIANNGAFITARSKTITLTSTPSFGLEFVRATVTGMIDFVFNTYSGSASGQQYRASLNGVVFTNGATLPGNISGITATGGQYA